MLLCVPVFPESAFAQEPRPYLTNGGDVHRGLPARLQRRSPFSQRCISESEFYRSSEGGKLDLGQNSWKQRRIAEELVTPVVSTKILAKLCT